MLVCETQRLGTAAVLIVALIVYGILLLQSRQPVREESPPWGSQRQGLTAVEVSGVQGRDGIYFLPEGTTLGKTLTMVGIPGEGHPESIDNAEISTGSILLVSSQGRVEIGEMSAARKLALGLPVDLNSVSEEELSRVPGIGEKTAFQIIRLRNEKGGFRDLADLTAVPGIKGKKLNSLKAYLMVRSVTE